MCLSGRCSTCQHEAIDAGINSKDLHAVVEFQKNKQVATVTITRDEYEQLEKDSFELSCLDAGGVDNWEHYHESLRVGGFFDNY